MVGATYRDFVDLIAAGEKIEILAKAGKLLLEQVESNQEKKALPLKKKEFNVN